MISYQNLMLIQVKLCSRIKKKFYLLIICIHLNPFTIIQPHLYCNNQEYIINLVLLVINY